MLYLDLKQIPASHGRIHAALCHTYKAPTLSMRKQQGRLYFITYYRTPPCSVKYCADKKEINNPLPGSLSYPAWSSETVSLGVMVVARGLVVWPPLPPLMKMVFSLTP